MPALDLMAWGLVVLWTLALWGGFLWSRWRHLPTTPRPLQMLSSLILVLLGWYGTLLALHPPMNRYAGLIALGMTAGFIGHLFMARLLRAPHRELMGMLAFGMGHVAYIAAIVSYAPVGWLGIILWMGVAAALVYWLILRGHRLSALRLAGLLYALFLAITVARPPGWQSSFRHSWAWRWGPRFFSSAIC